jgi:hypothetical protein
MPGHPGDMQVTVDDGGRVVTDVPVAGAVGAAPLRELRVGQDPRRLPHQRIVVHQHGRDRGVKLGRQPALGLRDPRPAPVLPRGVRVRVQVRLVRADNPRLVGHRQAVGLGQRAVGAEAVVVPDEQRRDRHRPVRPVPGRIGIFGRADPEPPAHLDQELIPPRAPRCHRVAGHGPQLVVAWNPHDVVISLGEDAQRPLDLGELLRDVPGDQQPVPRVARREARDQFPVPGMGHVQVADREQPWFHLLTVSAFHTARYRPDARLTPCSDTRLRHRGAPSAPRSRQCGGLGGTRGARLRHHGRRRELVGLPCATWRCLWCFMNCGTACGGRSRCRPDGK